MTKFEEIYGGVTGDAMILGGRLAFTRNMYIWSYGHISLPDAEIVRVKKVKFVPETDAWVAACRISEFGVQRDVEVTSRDLLAWSLV